MIVVYNSSPIIALSRCQQLHLCKELGFFPSFTTDLFKAAEQRKLIDSYENVMQQLHTFGIYLPE